MATAREQMKTINDELSRVRAEIERLRIEEEILVRLHAKLNGEAPFVQARESPRRTRAASIKPLVLQLVHAAGVEGLTTHEAAEFVKQKVPEVAKDTVGSVLSRLKSEGAFVYVGDRYFEKQYAPAHVRLVQPAAN